ncbi:MAG: hypothetical protein BGO68_02180 [Candidatus Amoebophilus sp. 36-38]|nr:MAG: hypothetical protein BGO68_02180 [Candidatus Amoebophilus sp. 36-38]
MKTPVLDHLIITERSYYSFKSSGLLEMLENSNKYVVPYDLEKQHHEEMEEEIKRVEQESKKKIKDSLKKGEEKGIKKGIEQIAKQMLDKGYSSKEVEELTGLSQQSVILLVEKNKLSNK